MRRHVYIHRGANGAEEVSIEVSGARCTFRRGGASEEGELVQLPDGRWSLLREDGLQSCGRVLPRNVGEVDVVSKGALRRIALAEPLRDRLAHSADHSGSADEDEEIRAQMPGRVVEVHVAAGERVAPGSLVLVLEAMKMQNELRTSRGGTVLRLGAAAGQAVEGGTLLAVVRAD